MNECHDSNQMQSQTADQLATRFQRDVSQISDQLERAARRYAHQPSDAEDLLQETLMRAWRAYDSFEDGSNFRAWLYRIMTNTWISGYRTAQRRPVERLVAEHLEEATGHPVTEMAAVDSAPAPEILEAMLALPESQRTVAYYAYVEGRKYKEIATMIGVPVGTVMSRLHRARQNLRARLTDYAFGQGYGAPGVTPEQCEAA